MHCYTGKIKTMKHVIGIKHCGCKNCLRKRKIQLRKWRENNKAKAAYSNLKNNAVRRNIFFDLTFEQFKEFAVKTNYIAKKGRSANSYV